MKDNQQPITGCGTGETAPYVFVCGDPARVPKITESWEDLREVCRSREYVIQTGVYEGVEMTAASTGIGAPSTAIVVEELVKLGGHTFIRVGNSGALAEEVALGDYVISTASVRDDGTGRCYVREAYPAAAHYEVVSALVQESRAACHRFHAGVSWSTDAFYARNKFLTDEGGLGTMCARDYSQSWMNPMMEDMRRAGVLNIEMESSILFVLASLYQVRAGCICTVSDRCPWPGPGQDPISLDHNIHGAIHVALRAMKALAGESSRAG